MHDAIGRHIGSDAAGFVRLVFSLHDPEELEALLDRAGFNEVKVTSTHNQLRLPAAEDFLWQYIHSTPLGAVIGRLDAEKQAALERDVVAGWTPWAAEGGLTYGQPILTASARRRS